MTTTEPRRRPRKRFGQHFLEPAWVSKVLAAIAPTAADTFLEIGPGRGALTVPLAARTRRVVAFEIDRDLAAALRTVGMPNLTIVEGDFLDLTPDRLRLLLADFGADVRRLRVAGNLPYNVASPMLFTLSALFEAGLPFDDATLMLQREVADRLLASPGTREYGVLTVLAGRRATAEPMLSLPPGAFRPAPKVRSTLVRFRFHPPDPAARDERVFERMVQAIFTRRRKTVANALLAFHGSIRLSPAAVLRAAGIDGGSRPEALTVAELVRLADRFAAGPALPDRS